MVIAVITDLHANLEAACAVFRELDRIKPDKTLCLGDLVGYNGNPNEVVDMVREREIPTVMGNHDAVACGLSESWLFNAKAQEALEWHKECLRPDNKAWLATASEQIAVDKLCLGVHGSIHSPNEYILDWLDAMRQIELLMETGIRVCFFGHSHRAALYGLRGATVDAPQEGRFAVHPGNLYLINPGSVGQPRDCDSRAAFGLYDVRARMFTFRRVEYDIKRAARKVLKAGLPATLAERLEIGR